MSDHICKQADCKYYGSILTGTCNYRTVTGEGRGCRIEGCSRFIKRGESEMRARKYDWDSILGEYDAGASPKELSAKHGAHVSAICGRIRRRDAEKRAEEDREAAIKNAAPGRITIAEAWYRRGVDRIEKLARMIDGEDDEAMIQGYEILMKGIVADMMKRRAKE